MEDGSQSVSASHRRQSFETAVRQYKRMLLVLKLVGVYVNDSAESSPRSKRSDILQRCYSGIFSLFYSSVALLVLCRQLTTSETKLDIMGGLMVSTSNFSTPTIGLCLFCKGSGFGQLIQHWTRLQKNRGYHGYPHITRFIKLYIVVVILVTVSALCNFVTATWASQDKDLFLIHSPFQFSNITAGDESVTLEVGLSLLYFWMSSVVALTVWTIFVITAYVIKTDFNFVYHALNKAIQSTALHGSSRKRRTTQNSHTECSGQEERDVEKTGDVVGCKTTGKQTSGNDVIDIEDARLYHDDTCGLLEKADAIFAPSVGVGLALSLFLTSVGLYQVVYGTTTDDSGFLFSMMSALPVIVSTLIMTSCLTASCVLVNKSVSKSRWVWRPQIGHGMLYM